LTTRHTHGNKKTDIKNQTISPFSTINGSQIHLYVMLTGHR